MFIERPVGHVQYKAFCERLFYQYSFMNVPRVIINSIFFQMPVNSHLSRYTCRAEENG